MLLCRGKFQKDINMNRLPEQLNNIKKKKIGLMTHVIVGYPDLEATISLVKTMANNGVDIVELQIPFSDPLADGPTIMRACEQSLAQGTKVKDAFTAMSRLTKEVSIPLLFMAYYNTVFVYGVEQFCKDAKAAGASGLIVPDMPLDEEPEEQFFAACEKYDLNHIQVISPASTEDRLKKNAEIANGFVYFTAKQGTTGAQDSLDPQLQSHLEKIKHYFNVPIAVGFGISRREHIEMLRDHADIAVIGSKIINVVDASEENERENNVAEFLRGLE